MKPKYLGLWLILALSLSLVILYSFLDYEPEFLSWKPKKAPFKQMLVEQKLEEEAYDMEADSLLLAEQEKVLTDSTPQSILLIGDSMTLNIALRMNKYAQANGHRFKAVNWDSSNTKIWSESDTLNYFIREFKPTFVFISLGSNELYLKKPDSRQPAVDRILAMIGDLPYVWIGPPNWKEDFGINDMIKSRCRPGSFFRSAGMEFKRKKDNVHPTREASALWVDSIMRWLPNSSHPFVANPPADSLKFKPADVVFLKALNK